MKYDITNLHESEKKCIVMFKKAMNVYEGFDENPKILSIPEFPTFQKS